MDIHLWAEAGSDNIFLYIYFPERLHALELNWISLDFPHEPTLMLSPKQGKLFCYVAMERTLNGFPNFLFLTS